MAVWGLSPRIKFYFAHPSYRLETATLVVVRATHTCRLLKAIPFLIECLKCRNVVSRSRQTRILTTFFSAFPFPHCRFYSPGTYRSVISVHLLELVLKVLPLFTLEYEHFLQKLANFFGNAAEFLLILHDSF